MKEVKEERMSIVLTLTRGTDEEGDLLPVEVECRADYEVASEDLTATRSMDVDLTIAQKKAIKDFGADILKKIKESEGIA